jgi:hypothetical protein
MAPAQAPYVAAFSANITKGANPIACVRNNMNAPQTRLMPTPPSLIHGLSEMAPHYDVILCDVWASSIMA